ncbi:hypothetical protein D3C85_695700 [compost metagenome]
MQLVLAGFQLGQLLALVVGGGGQQLAATVVFQGLLRIQHLLVQRLGLRLAGAQIAGHLLLGLELLEFALETILLLAQGAAVGEHLEGRRLDRRQVDGQPGGGEALAAEAGQQALQGFHPAAGLVEGDALRAEWQAEQCAVEQAHQALDVGLRELLAQPGVAVVVGVVELLPDRLEALLEVAQALGQILAGELPRLCQRAGQFVVGVLGGEQLLLQPPHVVDQGEAVLQGGQFLEPALQLAAFALQAQQFLGVAALLVLQAILLAAQRLVLLEQFGTARAGVVVPGAEQLVEQW